MQTALVCPTAYSVKAECELQLAKLERSSFARRAHLDLAAIWATKCEDSRRQRNPDA
jgi:hypothetical protein